MNKFKVSLMASMVAVALGTPVASQAVNSILFDQTGTGSGGSAITVGQFSYNAGNGLLQNLVDGNTMPGTLSTSSVAGNILAQAIASNVGAGNPGCAPAPNCTYYFTYEFNVPVVGNELLVNNGVLGFFVNTVQLFGTSTLGNFRMWAHTGTPNTSAGTGYGSDNGGILILAGSATIDPVSTAFVGQQNTQTAPFPGPTTSPSLDLGTIGGANRTVDTVILNGAASLVIDVTYQNTSYFLSDVSSLTLNLSLGLAANTTADMTQPEGFTAPFDPNNPVNDLIVGASPNYGTNGTNDFYCTDGVVATCDMHVGTTSNTFFNHQQAPEPGSLALLGLGMGLLGLGVRRRRQAAR